MADNKFTVEATDANFEQLVLKSSVPVVVDFWAQWCGPCLMVAPSLEEIAKDLQGRLVIAKLDVDSNPKVAGEFRITSIPTMLVFKNGKVVDKVVGADAKPRLKAKFEAHL